MSPAYPSCNRCGTRSPEPLDEGGGGDPALLVVIPPPDGWIGDPDDEHGGIVCGGCATHAEIVEWMGDLATIEHETSRPD